MARRRLIATLMIGCLATCGALDAQSPSGSAANPQEPEGQQEEQEPEEEESEVLEERRRGYEDDEPEEELKGARLYWEFGPRFDALDGDLSIIVGGRLHVDAAAFSRDPEIADAFGEPESGIEMRRAFVELGGVYKSLEFNFWVNFAKDFELFTEEDLISSDPDFRNVFVGLQDLPIIGGIRAGYFKEPFGLEEITSSNDITFMERSLTDAFIERRNLGVMLARRFSPERRMTASIGVYRDANNDLDLGDGYGVTGRVTGLPWFANDGRRLIHLGVAATYRRPSDDTLQFASRPESAQAQVMADTGDFGADRDLRVGFEAAMVLGSFALQSEYVAAASRRVDGGDDPLFQSIYVMGSYVLTGEHRTYRRRVGAFGAIHSERQFPLSGPGAWELTARYSYLDLDSQDIEGGVLHDVTGGLNWYLNDQTRLMFNYIAAHPEGFDIEHIFQMRFQLNF